MGLKMYARLSEDENIYAQYVHRPLLPHVFRSTDIPLPNSPMDFYPVIDCNSHEILTIDFPPTRNASNELSTGTTVPPAVTTLEKADCQNLSGRERIPPPMKKFGECRL